MEGMAREMSGHFEAAAMPTRERERTSEGGEPRNFVYWRLFFFPTSSSSRRHHNVYHLLTAAKVFESWLENIEPKIFDGRGECI